MNNLINAKKALNNAKNQLTDAINCSNKNISTWKAKYYKRIPSKSFQITLKNLGTVNKNRITMKVDGKAINLWFSYKTIVAFRKQNIIYCIQNQWGPTTGKLLNELCPNKSDRLPEVEFAKELNKLLII